MNRRGFLRTGMVGAAAVGLGGVGCGMPAAAPGTLPAPTARKLPRWRGFNLLAKFVADENGSNPPYAESEFAWMARHGFNFARLPMSYRCWSTGDPSTWLEMKETALEDVDAAVELGRRYGVHLNLNLHRAPGYCVNPPAEPLSLWKDQQALDAAAHHWAALARRYRGRANADLSFDLLNEPNDLPEATYVRVVTALVQAIRAEDPDRLIIADGLKWGTAPVPGLAGLGVAQSTRGYDPFHLTHYKAGWAPGSDRWPEPRWPLPEGARVWDKERLRRERIEPWKALEAKGVGVHVGEWGAFRHTPHPVVLAWMRDVLELWRDAGWGWSMWNLRGAFGPIDSGRADVRYETEDDLRVDRAMLDLLKAF